MAYWAADAGETPLLPVFARIANSPRRVVNIRMRGPMGDVTLAGLLA
jgi:hypothetical protein